jgi:hypothetical protein
MIASIKALYDLMAALLKERAQGKRQTFQDYTVPLYSGAKKVFDDYVVVFTDLKKMVRNERSLREMIDFVTGRRHSTLSTRHELRAFIGEFGDRAALKRPDLPNFENSILGMLEGTFDIAHTLEHFRTSLRMQMTLEDECRRSQKPMPSRAKFLERLDTEIDGQIRFLESKFQIIAAEYASMQADRTPHRLKRKKRNA